MEHNFKWSQNSKVQTHLAEMPQGESCRGKMLQLLEGVEGTWNDIKSETSPVFTQGHKERHSDLTYHTRQGGPIWGKGVKEGEIVVFTGTSDQIKQSMGERTAGFHYLSHFGEQIVGGFVVLDESYVKDYCAGNNAEELKQLLSHELGHMLGLGHADGSILMRDTLSVEGGKAAIPELSKEGAGLRWIYSR